MSFIDKVTIVSVMLAVVILVFRSEIIDLFQKNDDIVIVKMQPIKKNYYKFESYKKSEITTRINGLKKFGITINIIAIFILN